MSDRWMVYKRVHMKPSKQEPKLHLSIDPEGEDRRGKKEIHIPLAALGTSDLINICSLGCFEILTPRKWSILVST